MEFDLNSLSRKELTKLRSDVEKAIVTFEERERRAALEALQSTAAEYGYSLADLAEDLSSTRRPRAAVNAAKYRNPNNTEETWSGRGRKPKWVLQLEADGFDLTDAAI